MGSENRYAKIGKSLKRSSLVQQAKAHASLTLAEATDLATYGWPASRSEDLENKVAELETLFPT